MAIRRPLKLHSGNLRDMTTTDVDLIIDEVIRQYGQSPSVELTVNAGNGNLNPLTENRATAGAMATGTSPWPTADPTSLTTVTYENTVQSLNNTTFPYRTGKVYSNYSYPIYRNASGNIQSMNKTDVYDTFIAPALAKLVLSSTTQEDQAGTYFISTNASESGATQVSTTPIAADTNADIAAFSVGSLPETLDQSVGVNNFFLHRIDAVAGVNYINPVTMKLDTNDLIATPKTHFGTMMQDLINHHAAQTIRYNYFVSTNTTFGVARGTGITDTYTTGSTTRFEQPAPNTYYAQNVPSGTPTVQSTFFLRIGTV